MPATRSTSRNTVRIAIAVQVGEEVMTVTDRRPLVLSGDRRQWKRQIAAQVEEIAALMSTRFAPGPAAPGK
jgi:hypothetical protein